MSLSKYQPVMTYLEPKDIVKLKFTKNGEGSYVCAASGKVFGDSTKIAAVRTSGQVYSYDALETLCLAPKSLKDLVDGTPFARSDVLVLQVEQLGGIACHTGRESCFYQRYENGAWQVVDAVHKDPHEIYSS